MSVVKEFKEFATKGSVIDLAVGVVIGGAFQKIVDSAVNDIIMPPLGFIIGGIDFKDIVLHLNSKVNIRVGNFVQVILQFLIMAFAIFLMVKIMNKMRRQKAAEEEQTPPAV